jgi:uncharacterized protein with FMN-binding domain
MKRELVIVGIVLAAACLLFAACVVENDPNVTAGGAWETADGVLFSGDIEGKGPGFGGEVAIYLTLANGKITAVDFDISRETPAYVRRFPDEARRVILASNSPNIDVIAKVSSTSRGIRKAGKAALEAALGKDLDFGDVERPR